MENNYWIVDDLIIFKPKFNEELINYYNLINKYKKIMFSNYNDLLIAIKTNNKCIVDYKNNYIRSKFNQEIDLSNNINLTHLTFGWKFNHGFNIPFNVKSLNMYRCNNQYIIDNLHNNIEELKLYYNDLNLDNLPNLPNNIKKNIYSLL